MIWFVWTIVSRPLKFGLGYQRKGYIGPPRKINKELSVGWLVTNRLDYTDFQLAQVNLFKPTITWA